MPILNDILEHEVLGREFKKGLQEGLQEGLQKGLQKGRQEGLQEGMQHEALAILRRLIEGRFGPIPRWADERLTKRSREDLEELAGRVLQAQSLEELLM